MFLVFSFVIKSRLRIRSHNDFWLFANWIWSDGTEMDYTNFYYDGDYECMYASYDNNMEWYADDCRETMDYGMCQFNR